MLVERPEEPRPHSPVLPATAEAYWRSLYERERARAEEAEARCEELRWKEVDSRSRAGSLKWCLDNCRGKLAARVDKLKEVRRAAKQDVGALEAEVKRLEKQLRKAGVEPGEPSPLESLRKEAARLRRTVEKREKKIESLRAEAGDLREKVKGLETRLSLEKMEARFQKKLVDRRVEEIIDLCGKLRESREELRATLRAAGKLKVRLKERLLRAKESARPVSSRRDADLSARPWGGQRAPEDGTSGRCPGRTRGCGSALLRSETRRSRLEADFSKLRATGAVISEEAVRSNG